MTEYRSRFRVPRSGFVFCVRVQGSEFTVLSSRLGRLMRGTRNVEP